MRILHLVNHIRRTGNGIVNHVVDLSCQQAKDGEEVWIASEGGDYEPMLTQHGVRCVPLAQRNWKKSLRNIFALRQLLRDHDIQIIHAHMMSGALLAKAAVFRTAIPLVATVHNSWQRHSDLMRVADTVVVASAAVFDEMADGRIPRNKLRVVHYGISGTSQPRQSSGNPTTLEHRPAVVTVAGLYERKGIYDLLAVAEDWCDSPDRPHLYLVGDGPERSKLELEIRTRGLDSHVHLLGFRSDVIDIMASADVFVLASHHEPFGLVLLEARHAGCPIVATNVGGIPEVLEGGKAGVLVPLRSPSQLASAVQKILCDSTFSVGLSERARQGLDYWTPQRMASQTKEVYRECMESKRR